MKAKQLLLTFALLLTAGINVAWADTSVTFNGITWERGHGILTFDDTNKVITGTTSNWGCVGIKTASEATISVEKYRLTWLVITGTNLHIGENNPKVYDINGSDPNIKCISSKSSTTRLVFDITKHLPEVDGSGNVTITSLGFYLDDPNGGAGDHAITENQPTVTNIEIVYPETDSPIAPTNELLFRTNGDNSAWNSGFPKEANSTNQDYEINYYNGFYALQKYTVENLAAVKSLTVHIFGDSSKGHDAMAIWALGTNDWSSSSDASTLTSTVSAVVGLAPHSSSGDANSPLINGTSNRYTADGVQHCLFVISGDALATLKASATDNTFTLLITNRIDNLKSNTQRRYYTSGNSIVPFHPYIEVTSTYPAAIGNTGYETLNAAFDAVETTGTIKLYDDITITSRCNVGAKNITVEPVTDGVTVSCNINNGLWLLNNNASGVLTMGSSTHSLIIDGGNISNSGNHLEASTGGSVTTINNVTFQNCISTNDLGVVCAKNGGKLYIKDCSFNGCTANNSRGVVFCGLNDGIVLSGNNTFTDCTGYDIYLERRFQVNESEGVTNTTPIKIFAQENTILLGNPVATKVKEDEVEKFFIMNPTYALYKQPGGTRNDMKACEGYSLSVSSAGASTLVLPFAATIPSGVSCYTLNYTAGNDYVKATEVETTLPAATPVLVNAEEGLYKFKNSSNATTATSFEADATPTSGALTGVYQETTVPTGSYILANKGGNVGFYSVDGTSNKVRANRAYLTADGAGAKEALMIDFDGLATGIRLTPDPSLSKRGEEIFNLAGQRLSRMQKGINIVNGKKVLVK